MYLHLLLSCKWNKEDHYYYYIYNIFIHEISHILSRISVMDIGLPENRLILEYCIIILCLRFKDGWPPGSRFTPTS